MAGNLVPGLSRMLDEWMEMLSWYCPDPPQGRPRRRWFPPVTLERREDSVIIEASFPGLAPEYVELSLTARTLYLGAECAARNETLFPRAVRLPCEIDVHRVEAVFGQGVLRVICPYPAS
ncbi:MAG: Hsp20/alpha crystallin family protein [Armatimonadetes bacterium]|nr:Hsp20/alpha crystallin family protein [Armatimonadota bacterium]